MAVLTSKLIVSLVDQISGPARGAAAALRGLSGHANKTTAAIMGAGGGYSAGALARNLLAIGAGYVGVREGIGGTVGAAIKFEEAFADVRKVVDGTPAQLSVLKNEILEMSKVIPTSAEGIAEIVAAAGQSNIPYQELGKFTEMVAKVAVAWDVSERETSESLAKIKTQLNMNTDEIGLYADAINHLSNNTAATAPNLVDFAKRVAAQGDMFGFTATQSLAFGGAMIAAGGETEVAATSFRNMGMALADAANAPKRTRAAFKAIGVDALKIGKAFNKNSVGTMLDVFERINKLPEHQRLSAAIGIFGREARALMPLINDSRELRRELGLVASEANYTGSAFQEFVIRADTTGNVLDLLGNKFRARGVKYGESWLPTLKQFSLGVSDVIDTLDKRVGVIDQIEVAVKGLMSGFGYGGTGGMREMIKDIGDLVFGKAFEGDSTQVDQRMVDLARMSNNFRKIGKDLKAFAGDLSEGNVFGAMGNLSDAISKMSGSVAVAGALGIGVAGAAMLRLGGGVARLVMSPFGRITAVAYTAAKLIDAVKGANSIGEFADNLSKLSMVDWFTIGAGLWAVSGAVKSVRDIFTGGDADVGTGKKRKKPKGIPPLLLSGRATTLAAMPFVLTGSTKDNSYASASEDERARQREEAAKQAEAYNAAHPENQFGPWLRRLLLGDAADPDFNFREHMGIKTKAANSSPPAGTDARNVSATTDIAAIIAAVRERPAWIDSLLPANPSGPSDVSLVGTPPVSVFTPVETRPSGVQDVRLTNPPERPSITNHINVHVQSGASPQEIAVQIGHALAAKTALASAGAYSDGGM
ncbi:phage tail tape measure protein [Brucellaceae bacterium D45D]